MISASKIEGEEWNVPWRNVMKTPKKHWWKILILFPTWCKWLGCYKWVVYTGDCDMVMLKILESICNTYVRHDSLFFLNTKSHFHYPGWSWLCPSCVRQINMGGNHSSFWWWPLMPHEKPFWWTPNFVEFFRWYRIYMEEAEKFTCGSRILFVAFESQVFAICREAHIQNGIVGCFFYFFFTNYQTYHKVA